MTAIETVQNRKYKRFIFFVQLQYYARLLQKLFGFFPNTLSYFIAVHVDGVFFYNVVIWFMMLQNPTIIKHQKYAPGII